MKPGTMGFGWVSVPATWVQVPSRVLAGFESQPHGFKSQFVVNGFSRRDTITIKSNPITDGWVTHKLETIIPKKFFHCCEGLEHHNQASQPGSWTKGLEIPRESDLQGQNLITRFPQDWGNRLQSWRAQTKPCVHQDSDDRRSLLKNLIWFRKLNQNYLLVLEGLLGSVGQQGLTTGMGGWQQLSGNIPFGINPLGSCH